MQHDFDITKADANTGSTFRAAVNAALQALASNNSGIGDPSITYPYEFKFNTSESPVGFYVRKADNLAWFKAGYVDALGQLILLDNGVDDTSANVADMQATTDPYPGSVESLATSLRGELQRIRYLLKQITGKAQWYIDPDNTIAALQASTNSVGVIQGYAGASAPAGWLLCDGSAVSRTTYAALFAIIGTTYGIGDGSTTFNVPNMKGKTIVGFNAAETEFDVLGETGGEKTHTLITAEVPAHTHTNSLTAWHSELSGGGNPYPKGSDIISNPTTSNASSSTGGGGAHNNLQPYIAVNYIIKY